MGVKRSDPPEARKIALMRRATTIATHNISLTGKEKRGAFRKRPVTLPKGPWDDKPKGEPEK